MTTVALLHSPVLRFFDAEGAPLSHAKLYSFNSGTDVPHPLYTDAAGTEPHTNPAIADAAGQLVAYAEINYPYRLDLFDEHDVHQDGWPLDAVETLGTETGLWTPTIAGLTTAGAATYSVQEGWYQRLGTLINFTARLDWSGHTGTGAEAVTGLPLPSANPLPNVRWCCVYLHGNLVPPALQLGQMHGQVYPGETQIRGFYIAELTGLITELPLHPQGVVVVTGTYTMG